jgi:hypothetical protein
MQIQSVPSCRYQIGGLVVCPDDAFPNQPHHAHGRAWKAALRDGRVPTVMAGGRAWSQLSTGGEWFEVDPAEATAKFKRLLRQWRWEQRWRRLWRWWTDLRPAAAPQARIGAVAMGVAPLLHRPASRPAFASTIRRPHWQLLPRPTVR